MNMNEAREIKLRQMRAKRRRVVRLQKMILSASLAVMVCFAGGMHLLLNKSTGSFIADRLLTRIQRRLRLPYRFLEMPTQNWKKQLPLHLPTAA